MRGVFEAWKCLAIRSISFSSVRDHSAPETSLNTLSETSGFVQYISCGQLPRTIRTLARVEVLVDVLGLHS